MDIALYREKCSELIAQFGEKQMPKEMLNAAWAFWRSQTDRDFIDFVETIRHLPFPINLLPKSIGPLLSKPPTEISKDAGVGSRIEPSDSDSPIEHIDVAEDIGMKPRVDIHSWKPDPNPHIDQQTLDRINKKYGTTSISEIITRGLWKSNDDETHPAKPTTT